MNENIDLTKILKNCPMGTKLYSLIHGYVEFSQILDKGSRVIEVISITNGGKRYIEHYTFRGKLDSVYNNDECVLFPSQTQRDWSKFTAPWYKKEKYDPKTLKPLDSVIVRSDDKCAWFCDSFSYVYPDSLCVCTGGCEYKQCVPYNDETEHLIGTTDEAPEFYKYWED